MGVCSRPSKAGKLAPKYFGGGQWAVRRRGRAAIRSYNREIAQVCRKVYPASAPTQLLRISESD